MINKLLLAIIFSSSAAIGQQTLVDEGFSAGIPATWAIVNADSLNPDTEVSEFTDAWIQRISGADTVAASTSYYDPTGQSEDYLILPKLSLLTISKLKWDARSVDPSWPDSYYVLISTTDSLITSFTDTLLTVNSESPTWQMRSIHLDTMGYANQDVYIAFRNFANDQFILELDNVQVTSDDNVFIEENEIDFSVYPNPTSERLFIRNSNQFNSEYIITDTHGRTVLRSDSPDIYVGDLPNGMYIVSTITDHGSYTTRFVKK